MACRRSEAVPNALLLPLVLSPLEVSAVDLTAKQRTAPRSLTTCGQFVWAGAEPRDRSG